jgi:GWxTD domain-containing protein
MLPDEEKTFRDLKDKAERVEFQKIFWARRDPDLDTTENEYQAAYNSDALEVDRQFRVAGQAAPPRTAAASISCSASRTR